MWSEGGGLCESFLARTEELKIRLLAHKHCCSPAFPIDSGLKSTFLFFRALNNNQQEIYTVAHAGST